MFFDGSKMLNGSGAGVVLVSPRGDKLRYVLQIHFDSSNNESEYEALLYGLRMAISFGVRRLMVYGDSDLVVNQVMKEWDVRSPAMTGYCNAVRKLEKKFEGLELHHIPRLKNQAADELAKIVPREEPFRVVCSWSIYTLRQSKKILSLKSPRSLRVPQIRLKSKSQPWST